MPIPPLVSIPLILAMALSILSMALSFIEVNKTRRWIIIAAASTGAMLLTFIGIFLAQNLPILEQFLRHLKVSIILSIGVGFLIYCGWLFRYIGTKIVDKIATNLSEAHQCSLARARESSPIKADILHTLIGAFPPTVAASVLPEPNILLLAIAAYVCSSVLVYLFLE